MNQDDYITFLKQQRDLAQEVQEMGAVGYAHASYCLKNPREAYTAFLIAALNLKGEGWDVRSLDGAKRTFTVPAEWLSMWVVVPIDSPAIKFSVQSGPEVKLTDAQRKPIPILGHGPTEADAWNSAFLNSGRDRETAHGPR